MKASITTKERTEEESIAGSISKKRKLITGMMYILLLFFSVIATLKMMILGLNIDEEYAIAMSYRMVTGDRMFLEMWEPHQTSGFVSAFFIRLYLGLFHTKEYLVLYLRGVGVLLQGCVSLFIYTTLRKRYRFDIAFMAVLITFNVLPKWILVPEFSNLLLWCSLCTWMCLMRYEYNIERGRRWLIAGALFYCGMVLAYPTCVLLLPVYIIGLYKITPKTCRKAIWIFPCVCCLAGIFYILYFLMHMTCSEFLFGLQQMVMDEEHSMGVLERLLTYAKELKTYLFPLILIMIPSGIIGRIKGKYIFAGTLVCMACLQQMVYWLGPGRYINTPLIFFYIVYGVGAFCRKKEKALFWLGYIPSCFILLAVLMLTNTTIAVSGVYLLPGMICACIYLQKEVTEQNSCKIDCRWIGLSACVILLGVFLFAKGWLVNETEGFKADIRYVKQKALSGPAKNVYCRYTDGYNYNELAQLLKGKISEEDRVLYVGCHSLRYLLTDAEISTYSTISTPTFNDRLLTYWEIYPEKYPTIIIVDKNSTDWEYIRSFFELEETGWETEEVIIYVTK